MRYVPIVAHRVVELARIVKYATTMGAIPATEYNMSTGASLKATDKVFTEGVWRPREAE